MESTFGRIISGFLGLLALAAVVVLGYESTTKSNDAGTVAAIFSLAQNVRGDYANNSAGYVSLSNTTAIESGEAPPAIVKSGALVDPWGNAMSVGAISGNVHAFQVSFGPVPTGDCAQIASDMTSADGIQIGANSTPLTPPYDVGSMSTACVGANGGPITLMYGGVAKVGVAAYLSGTTDYANTSSSGANVPGFNDSPSYGIAGALPQYLASQYVVNNTTGSPKTVTLYTMIGAYGAGAPGINSSVSGYVMVNQVKVASSVSLGGGLYPTYYEQAYTFTIPPGQSYVALVQNTGTNAGSLGANQGWGLHNTLGVIGAQNTPPSGVTASNFQSTILTSAP